MRPGTVLLLALALFGLTSCRKDPPPVPAEPAPERQVVNPAPSEPPAVAVETAKSTTPEPVRLSVQWPLGHRYVYRMDLTQRSTNALATATAAPVPANEDVALGVTYALTVLGETPNGGRELEVEFLAYELQIKVAAETVISFDCLQNTGATNSIPPPFRKLIGSKVRLQTDARGSMASVVDLKDWTTRLAGDATGPAGQMLVQQFNEGFFQQMISFGRGLPLEAVQMGQSWPYRAEMPAGALGKIVVDSVITLQRWADQEQQRYAVLEARGTLQGAGVEPAAGGIVFDAGTVRSTSWFDPALGALVESTVEQTMRLKGEVPSPEPDAPAAAFRSEVDQKVALKLVEWGRATL